MALFFRYKRMARGDKEALWADVQHFVSNEYSPDDVLTPLRSSTALEADSIGRLTRTLSAAARGKPAGDYPESTSLTHISQPMYNHTYPVSNNTEPCTYYCYCLSDLALVHCIIKYSLQNR